MILLWLLLAAAEAQELLNNPRCNLPLDRGTCMQFTVNWYYDRYAHRCREFHYGGCEGNDNRFRTLEECNAACTYRPPSNRDRCFQPHDPGQCNGDFERWYFDANKRQCVCSWWSGCGGNSNLFYSYKHCMLICGEFAVGGAGVDDKYMNHVQHQWHQGEPTPEQYAEFRSSTAHSSHSAHSSSLQSGYQYSSPAAGRRSGYQRPKTVQRAHGERIYRYDTGPIQRRHPNGTITVNRQVIFYTGSHPPRMDFIQQLPGLLDFSRAQFVPPTPPPAPQTTTMPSLLRRRLKQLMKKKIPPRRIRPQTTPNISSVGDSKTEDRHLVEWRGGSLPTVVVPLRDNHQELAQSRQHQTEWRDQPNPKLMRKPLDPRKVDSLSPIPLVLRREVLVMKSYRPQSLRTRRSNWQGNPTIRPRDNPTPPSVIPRRPSPTDIYARPTDDGQRPADVAASTGIQRTAVTTAMPAQAHRRQPDHEDNIRVYNVHAFLTLPEGNAHRPSEPSITRPKVDFDEVMAIDSQVEDDYEEPVDDLSDSDMYIGSVE
ncbi:Kunitz/Bovine pancreatic trypsin inhibitor domain protein, partial [Ostertagia ostertagi]